MMRSPIDAGLPPRPRILSLLAATALISLLIGSLPSLFTTTLAWGGSGRQAVDGFGRLPISFEPNIGQAENRYDFFARGQGFEMGIDPTGATLILGAGKSLDVVRLDLLGSRRSARPRALEPLSGTVNYFIGDEPSRWRSGVPTFARVSYDDVLPGVDVTYHGSNVGRLEYDFIVAPRADPDVIRIVFSGGDLALRDGSLAVTTAHGEVIQDAPVLYQTIAGQRVPVSGAFSIVGNEVGFEVGPYDRRYPLVIDPTLAYSTYLGGLDGETAQDIAVDASGAAYVVGRTSSAGFPTVAAFSSSMNGAGDALVTKLAPNGSALVYSTYLGGSNATDQGLAIAVDVTGAALVTGLTWSSDFPTTVGAFDTSFNGGNTDAFVTKLEPDGSALAYSSFLGSNGDDGSTGIALDAAGAAYVTGSTNSLAFPLTSGAFDTIFQGAKEAFVSRFNVSGSGLNYSTFLGGSGAESGSSIIVDSGGEAYVTGATASTDYPTTVGAFDISHNGNNDAFVTKLNSSGTSLVYSTYLGAAGRDEGEGIDVDASGETYVIGATPSVDFPTTPGTIDTTYNGGGADGFITKLNATGSGLIYSTYLGGSDYDWGYDIDVNATGRAYVVGTIDVAGVTTDFPTTSDAIDPSYNGGSADVFVAELDPAGASLVHSSYLGGSDYDEGFGIAVDPSGAAYLTGDTFSSDFPTTPGVFDTSSNGDYDVFVAKIDPTYPLEVARSGSGSGTVTTVPAGIDCGATCNASYNSGASVTLTSTPDPGSLFVGWSGDCAGTGTCTVTMTAARNVIATFDVQPPPPPSTNRSLTVTTAGAGVGSVESSPSGIACGSDCSQTYSSGTMVTLTATAEPGSMFVGWLGDCSGLDPCTLTMSADHTATAMFDPTFFLVNTKEGTGTGTVTSLAAGIDCGDDCSETYMDGTSVMLTAHPSADSIFLSWDGCDSVADMRCEVTMSADRVVTVTFDVIPAAAKMCGGEQVTLEVAEPGLVTYGTMEIDVILGTPGNDVIYGLNLADIICGLGGDDRLYGGGGNDGGKWGDSLYGGPGRDRLAGDGGDDLLTGGAGSDRLYGNVGHDSLIGGGGSDSLHGNEGKDVLTGGSDDDVCNGGPGTNDSGHSCETNTNIP